MFEQLRILHAFTTFSRLQRNGTVQLWEKEKTKLLEGSKQREENLTRELKELREAHEDMKERLQRRIKVTH